MHNEIKCQLVLWNIALDNLRQSTTQFKKLTSLNHHVLMFIHECQQWNYSENVLDNSYNN